MTLSQFGIFGGLSQLGAASKVPWYLAGGVALANVVAAYQPKGAANLAASYINLANPGTYNAAPGVAPTWAAVNGWIFNGSTQYLTTGVVPAVSWSAIVRIADNTNSGIPFGCWTDAQFIMYIIPRRGTTDIGWRYGRSAVNKAPAFATGVLGITSADGYRDGVAEGLTFTNAGTNVRAIVIGALNEGTISSFFAGNIIAISFYNTTLTAPQVLAISNSLAAL